MKRNTQPTIATLTRLVKSLKPTIGDDYRADEQDDKPGMCLTVGADLVGGWDYQTGDNSYSGGAYHYPAWGVVSIYRRSRSAELARDIRGQIEDACAE